MSQERNCRVFETMSRNARIEVHLSGVHWIRNYANLNEAARHAEGLRLIDRGMGHVIAATAAGFPNIYRCHVADDYDTRQLRAAGFSSMSLLGRAYSQQIKYPQPAASA